MERKEGYYWVLYFTLWTIAEYNSHEKLFLLCGMKDAFDEDSFEEIKETPIVKP